MSINRVIYNASDITAGLFLLVLIGSIALQQKERKRLQHLLAAAIFIYAGITVRVLAGTIGSVPGWSSRGIWILSFILISLGVFECVTHVISLRNPWRKGLKLRIAMTTILIIAAIIVYSGTGSSRGFTVSILIQLVFYICLLSYGWSDSSGLDFALASMAAILTYIITAFFSPVRLTGPGLSLILIILYEQYQARMRQELAEKEKDLAKRKMQLLADQISPHYIYNSLQNIRSLCETDPLKARDALDAFSDYLRGNLESLTDEELIPFEVELEHTRTYLELEKLAGIRTFDVEYALETTDFMLPPLVLQSVVENAVQHGAAKGSGRTIINIATYESDRDIRIEVTDRTEGAAGISDGMECVKEHETAKNRKRKSVGLGNVSTRVALQCGGKVALESTAEGAKTVIILPKTANPQKR